MVSRKTQQPLEHRMLQTAIFCLLAGGAVMVYSASSARTLLQGQGDGTAYLVKYLAYGGVGLVAMHVLSRQDRKSTRLNSSHANISYAVFCLKKKKIKYQTIYICLNAAT